MDRFGNAGRGASPVGFLYSDALGHPWVPRESMGCMYGMYPAFMPRPAVVCTPSPQGGVVMKFAHKCVVAAMIVACGTVAAAPTPVDSINGGASPAATTWSAAEAGWLYSPTESYSLSEVQTRFASTDGRTVAMEIWDQAPVNGGHLLRAASTSLTGEPFATWSFAALDLRAGEDYFFGFRNISGLDVNFTRDAGATNLGRYYFSFTDAGEYEREVVSSTISGAQPILRFSGTRAIPEPASSALAALALSLLLVRVGKRADR
ncbi:MAG: hypothetical protein JNK06_04730 [Candidatus Accumulibacter phosphatis]|uniref:hypothetical protein n=1 Tax=Candidatus Accumulibacter phosphatis TaxID=327160 RepID=UPI001A4CD5B7|nr:hypothetical protein [Candidatus Accumulibacter phosphatis]